MTKKRRKKKRKYQQKRYWQHPETYREHKRKWRKFNPVKQRIETLQRKGVDPSTLPSNFAELVLEGKCKICGVQLKPCADHDHAILRFRGILCDDHNKGIGYFKENIDHLKRAIQYLRDWQESP